MLFRSVAIFGKVVRNFPGTVHKANVELTGPETLRIGRRQMPVILFLIRDQHWRLPWRADHGIKWHLRNRQPAHEMRIGLERIGGVIEEYGTRCAGKDDRMTGAGTLQSLVVSGFDGLDMVRIKRFENRVIDIGVFIHADIIAGFRQRRESRKERRPGVYSQFQSTCKLGIIYGFPEWLGDMYESRSFVDVGTHG